jgi:hypothetical protein
MSHNPGSDELDEMPPMLRQQYVLDEFARTLADQVQGTWSRLIYLTNAAGGQQENQLEIHRPDGTVESASPPRAVIPLNRQLRAAMYSPEAGTWFSAAITVDAGTGVSADFNYDDEPQWHGPVAAQSYADDARRYPRSAGATPDWLRRRLAEAGQAE